MHVSGENSGKVKNPVKNLFEKKPFRKEEKEEKRGKKRKKPFFGERETSCRVLPMSLVPLRQLVAYKAMLMNQRSSLHCS